jgi:hypothetical protein
MRRCYQVWARAACDMLPAAAAARRMLRMDLFMTTFLRLNIEATVIATMDLPVTSILVNPTLVAIYVFEITVP